MALKMVTWFTYSFKRELTSKLETSSILKFSPEKSQWFHHVGFTKSEYMVYSIKFPLLQVIVLIIGCKFKETEKKKKINKSVIRSMDCRSITFHKSLPIASHRWHPDHILIRIVMRCPNVILHWWTEKLLPLFKTSPNLPLYKWL